MTTLSFPTLTRIAPAQLEFALASNTVTHTSPLSGAEQTIEFPGARWRFTFSMENLTEADAALLQAFLVRLRGRAGRFTLHNMARPTPRGIATGTPLVKGASQTGATLITDGWTPSKTGILKAGDFIGVNGELKMVVADANSDAGGNATLSIEPPLRASPADNAAITTDKPTAIFRLAGDDSAWTTRAPIITNIPLQGVETFT